jgi:D-sorbitol dehydrogenase (acceptor)
MELKDRVALVAGGASGIGSAIAAAAAAQGATVVVGDRNMMQAHEVAGLLDGAKAVHLDVADQASVESALDTVARDVGPVDLLFNSAAVWEMTPFLEATRDAYRRQFAVNVEGLFFLQQALARRLVARKAEGAIVNLASQAGRRGEAVSALYAASKASVISMTQSAALALAPHRIRVNAVAPGCVDTPMWDVVDRTVSAREGSPAGTLTARVTAAIPLGRLATPKEVAEVAVFLAGPRAVYVTGQTVNVDGGSVLS